MRAVVMVWALLWAVAAQADVTARDGWAVFPTDKPYDQLVSDVQAAVKANKMGVVTRASATAGAKAAGITIPGNMIVGVYRNDFARRMLEASVASGIEAPIRYYLTENTDGTTTLSYKTPTKVFEPYFEEGGDDLKALATELDTVFAKIADEAVQ